MAVIGQARPERAGGEQPGRRLGIEREAAGIERDRPLRVGDDEHLRVEMVPERAAGGRIAERLEKPGILADQRIGSVRRRRPRLGPAVGRPVDLALAEAHPGPERAGGQVQRALQVMPAIVEPVARPAPRDVGGDLLEDAAHAPGLVRDIRRGAMQRHKNLGHDIPYTRPR